MFNSSFSFLTIIGYFLFGLGLIQVEARSIHTWVTEQTVPSPHYTHVRYDSPLVSPNGTVSCVPDPFVSTLHAHNMHVLWGGGLHLNASIIMTDNNYKRTYLQTIGQAMDACDIDGIEFDYEFNNNFWSKLGIVTPAYSTAYSEFLWQVKQATNKNKTVGADISIWGLAKGNYILGVLPWVNATYLNSGKIDYVNTMSYHWDVHGDIAAWEKDLFFLITVWTFRPERIHLGVPFYSRNGTQEPSWRTLSVLCPNVEPTVNDCMGVPFVGKQMQQHIGALARKHMLGGLFPWCASFDSTNVSNALIPWLVRGFLG